MDEASRWREVRLVAHDIGADGRKYEFVIVDEHWCGVRRDQEVLFVLKGTGKVRKVARLFNPLVNGRLIRLPRDRGVD